MPQPLRVQNPTPDYLAALAERWATRAGTAEDETTVVIPNSEPDRFYIWSGRGPDLREVLKRAAGRLLEVTEYPHGCRFVFPRSALAGTGVGAILRSQARQDTGRRVGFPTTLGSQGSTDATERQEG